MKHGMFLLALCVLVLLNGCGHSVLVESEVTGFSVRVPIAEAGNLGITLGSAKLTTATIRGGTTLETSSSAGGGIFSGDGGVSRITTFKTNAQLNEGNLRDVLTCDNVPDAAKIALASNLVAGVVAPRVPQTVLQTPTATIHTGGATISNNVESINRISGLDKIADTVPSVVEPVVNVIPETVHETVTPVADTVTNVTTSIVDTVIGGVTDITDQVTDSITDVTEDTSDILKDIKWITVFKWAIATTISLLLMWLTYNKVIKTKSDDEAKPKHVFAPVDPDALGEVEEAATPEAPPDQQEELPLEFPTDPSAPPPNEEQKDQDGTAETTGKKKKKRKKKTPWYKKIVAFFSITYALFMKIPPEIRQSIWSGISTAVKNWIAKRRAEKQAKQPPK